ncbi:GroES-like protein [Dendrothele bispora CBS 962.96]|uniref:GroES-like protein n=1 Tax=Dendrothele bispora (strain CBS 962.96) TaxID=1314807 RepID=A0A4S8L9L0_DENBC|nr:GroES-like protein [Dendrothele bispora CBS 962.96]
MSEQKALLIESKQGRFVENSLSRFKATALNPIDWKAQEYGMFYEKYPAIVGSDVAGDVEDVGEGVVGFKKGDRVFLQGSFANEYGGFQQYTRARADFVAHIPEQLSYSQAASIPLTLATAAIGLYANQPSGIGLNPLFDTSANYSGQAALVIGGSTSVGQYAIQLLRYVKFGPIITYASGRHSEYLKSLGATECIDRNHVSLSELPEVVKKLTGGVPVNVVYDAISNNDSQLAGYEILAEDGGMVLVTGENKLQDKIDATGSKKTVVRVYAYPFMPAIQEFGKAMYKNLTKLVEDGDLVPNRVEDLPNGLAGITAGLERLKKNQVSGVKLAAYPQETL